jgi:hypothetical protein
MPYFDHPDNQATGTIISSTHKKEKRECGFLYPISRSVENLILSGKFSPRPREEKDHNSMAWFFYGFSHHPKIKQDGPYRIA